MGPSMVGVIALLVLAAFAGTFLAGQSASHIVEGGRNVASRVGADPRLTHLQQASRSASQGVPAPLLADNSPAYPSEVATVPVGSQPTGIAYDAARGEVFVTNEGVSPSWAGNVSVINDTNDTVVATIPVGSYPVGAAYDRSKGEVFVSNDDTSNVSVINDTTNKVVATVSVGYAPWGMAYDAAKGEVFVTHYLSGYVNVINDTTNTVTATVPVGSWPFDAAYDTARGEVFVANAQSANVSVISDTLDIAVATVTVGYWPLGIAYDSARGEVFVVEDASNRVSVINDTNNSVVTTVPVGFQPRGIAYDSARGEVFVTNEGLGVSATGNVSVINDTTDTVVATVPVGVYPVGMTYDKTKGEVFVANEQSNNVSVISDGSVSSPYAITFTTNPSTCGSITFNGATHANGQSIEVFAGSYAVSTLPCAGYELQSLAGTGFVSVSSGSATVHGVGRITATFSPVVGFLGLAGDEGYYVVVGIAAGVMIVVATIVLVRRRKRGPAGPTSPLSLGGEAPPSKPT